MLLSVIRYKGEGFQVNALQAEDPPLVSRPCHHHVCEITNPCHDLPHPSCSYIYIHFFGLSLDFNSKHEEAGGGKCEDGGKAQNTKPSTYLLSRPG